MTDLIRGAGHAQELDKDELAKFLAIFLGADERFQVAVGGNPIAVDKMLADARAALAKHGGRHG
jgi:hypothetical protein